jgi:starch phosphorylase
VAVELYAEPVPPNAEPGRVPMISAGALPGTSHGFLYRATVPGGRPAGDWTARIVPTSKVAQVPTELPLITWHH